jgi:hypothetical protein
VEEGARAVRIMQAALGAPVRRPSMRPIFQLLLSVAVASATSGGCAARQRSGGAEASVAAPQRFRIDLTLDVRSVVEGTASHPWTAAPDERTALELTVETSASRTFRDGSEGTLVRVTAARHGADAEAGLEAMELGGRSFELRVFEGREILAADLVEHLVGPARQLDVYDLLLPVLSPFPPPLDVGQSAARAMRWPLVVAPDRYVRGTVAATWTNVGLVEVEASPAWRLDYQGPWTGKLRDGRAQGAVKGTASGSVWIDAASGALARHDFDWKRQVEMRYPAPEGEGVRILQDQHFVGRLQQVSE